MMKMDRRQFLTSTLASAGGVLLTGKAQVHAQTPTPAAAPFSPYDMVPLGKTGLKVSRVGCGTGMTGGNRQSNQTRLGKDTFETLLKTAYERGVRLFDLADMYGTHPFAGRALKGFPRESYTLVSKIWVRNGGLPEKDRPDANIVIDRFRQELQTDYIDLVLIHCMTSPNWTDEQKKQMDIMADLKAKKIIGAHGVSIHSLPALKAAAASPWVDSVHARINHLGVAMDGKPDEVVPVLQQFHAAGKGVIGMKIIGEGRFRNSDEQRNESIKYVLKLGCVDAVVVGFEKVAEIDDFASRVTKVMTA